jgi:hypothetical protein
MFYLAMSYNDHTSITSGFATYDDAYAYLSAVAHHHLELDDEGSTKGMDDSVVIYEFFDAVDDGNWIITDTMVIAPEDVAEGAAPTKEE